MDHIIINEQRDFGEQKLDKSQIFLEFIELLGLYLQFTH